MKRNRWLLFIVLYISAFAVSASQLKIVPVLGDLAAGMEISLTQTSFLMSVFTIAGIILAIPGGALLNKIGPKKLLLFLLGSLIIGNLLGAFFYSNYPVFLISRIIEGIAFSMIIMTGIVFISEWFAGGKVGLAIGVFTTFPGAASAVFMNASVPISNAFGMGSLWIIVGALSIITFILVSLVIKQPAAEEAIADGTAGPSQKMLEKPSVGAAISNSKMWILAICQGCVAFVLFTFITIYPTMFQDFYNLEVTTANFYAGLNGLFGIPFCIIAGIIIDKTGKPALLTLYSFILMAFTCFITAVLGPKTYVLHTLLIAISCGFVIPAVLAIAPSIAKKPILIGYTVAFINMIYYVGIFIGAPVILAAVASSGWQTAANILGLVAIIGIIFSIIYLLISRKKVAAKQQ
ncbi:MAG: CynX/NimT family MFS transporter [Bacillota bacterium]|jgi:predicted MFS family arabinose efflux permease